MAEDVVVVTFPGDVHAARQASRLKALAVGFDGKASEEVAIVAGELASNLVRHGGGGTIRTIALARQGRAGIQIEALDHGAGIPDVELALTDGYSTGGSLGYGLGTVNRLMDELEVSSTPPNGTYVVCRRWVRDYPTIEPASPLEFGVATVPYPAMKINGDAFVLKHWGHQTLAGVIDGVGHGPSANEAAGAARQYVENHFDQPLDAIFRGTARACRSNRGVVMALVHFDWGQALANRILLSFASVGNVEARGCSPGPAIELAVRRGILGLNAPQPIISASTWTWGSMLVLHSDGLRTSWRWSDFPTLPAEPAQSGAMLLLRELNRHTDDATVLVIKDKSTIRCSV